jgi:hypothetical protein
MKTTLKLKINLIWPYYDLQIYQINTKKASRETIYLMYRAHRDLDLFCAIHSVEQLFIFHVV